MYRATRVRQTLHPSPRTIATLGLFSKSGLTEVPAFYTNAERIIHRDNPLDMEQLKQAKNATRDLAKTALTLVSPIMVSTFSNERGGGLRLHFAVKETDRLEGIEDTFRKVFEDGDLLEEGIVPGSVYVEVAKESLATNLQQLYSAREELKRQAGGGLDGRSLLRVSDLHIAEKDIYGTLDLAA